MNNTTANLQTANKKAQKYLGVVKCPHILRFNL
jgi:hypothetical protein